MMRCCFHKKMINKDGRNIRSDICCTNEHLPVKKYLTTKYLFRTIPTVRKAPEILQNSLVKKLIFQKEQTQAWRRKGFQA